MQTQIGSTGSAKNAIRKIRQSAVIQHFMLEDPHIPDVHTRVSVWRSREVACDIASQWPGENQRDDQIPAQSGAMPQPVRRSSWQSQLRHPQYRIPGVLAESSRYGLAPR
jgi:hypothetical protein